MIKNPVKKNTQNNSNSNLGLAGLGDLSDLLNTSEAINNNGRPIDLDVNLIDEDLNQPRTETNPGFSNESLNELATSIRLRGVKTPISVRHNPDADGRYIINHGARRFRASKIAGKETIPGFIDNDYVDDDQVIENLHRDDLTAREIADHIGRKLAKGMKKGEIAKAICKSPAFVTQHVALLDLPDPIAIVFNNGRVKDVTTVNELVTAYKNDPEEVEIWLSDENQELTRTSVKLLREYLEENRKNSKNDNLGEEIDESVPTDVNANDDNDAKTPQNIIDIDDIDDNTKLDKNKKVDSTAETDTDKFKKSIVLVEHNGRNARLLLAKRPSEIGYGWLKYEDDGEEFEASLKAVVLIKIMEG